MSDMERQAEKGPTYRAALTAVIILTALFAAGVVALVFGFMRQYRIYQADKGAAQTLALPPGGHIISSETRDGRLILHVQTPHGGEVEVIDLSSGKLLTRIKSGP